MFKSKIYFTFSKFSCLNNGSVCALYLLHDITRTVRFCNNSTLQSNFCLKIDFQKVDQHAGGKWLIHDTKRRKENQLQILKLHCRISSWVARCYIKGSDGTMLNPIFWKKVQGQKHPGMWGIVEHQIPSIKVLFKTNAKSHRHPGIKLFSS